MMDAPAYLPRLSKHDPAESAEGTIDPLGLAALAGRLADALVPGFTERSRRPRFLTFLALGTRVLSRYPEGLDGDHQEGPAYLAFERLVLESFAAKEKRAERAFLRVPGIGKARLAREADARLVSRLYLKNPAAVGLWVSYKRLAVSMGILDPSGYLGEAGNELLLAWEEGIGESGLLRESRGGNSFLKKIDHALDPLLGNGRRKTRPQAVWQFLHDRLRPDRLSRQEAKVIRLLLMDRDERRREVFEISERRVATDPEARDVSERAVVEALAGGSEPLKCHVKAIIAYEDLAALLNRAFTILLHIANNRKDGRIDAGLILADPDVGKEFASLPDRLHRAHEQAGIMLEETSETGQVSNVLDWLLDESIHSPEGLFERLIERHVEVQRQKPPDGKRPWIEGTPGSYFVRPRYLRDELPQENAWVHTYRTGPIRNFLDDMAGAF